VDNIVLHAYNFFAFDGKKGRRGRKGHKGLSLRHFLSPFRPLGPLRPLKTLKWKAMKIAADFKGILLDSYGVFWGSNAFGLLPGAKECMEALVASGKVVGVLSNSTQLASKEIAKLHSHGLVLNTHFHFLVTSGEVTRQLFQIKNLPFKSASNKFYLFGGVHPKYSSHQAIFQGTDFNETQDVDEAGFVYIGVPHVNGEDQTQPDVFRNEIERVLKKGLSMVCANPDLFAHEGNPPKAVVRQGMIAKMYTEMGGKVFYIGKPFENAYIHAMSHFNHHGITNPTEILMIGDTPETDIRGARQFGMSSALVTQTGIMADRISHRGHDSAVKELLPSDVPNFFIGRFANDI
jgi:HAD superfamily hydrolase (TIGR01459 family)